MSWLANPVLVRESRARMRGKRVFVVLAVVLCVLWLTLFLAYQENTRHRTAYDYAFGAEMLAVLAVVQTIMIGLLTPAFSCGAFTFERERLTFDLLVSTTLPAREIVLGKLASSLYYIFLLIVASLPMMSFCIFFGGLALWQVFAVTGIMLLTAVFFASVGIWFSALQRRTATCAATSYGVLLFLTAGVPFLSVMMTEVLRWRFGLDDDAINLWSTVLGPIVPILEILVKEVRRDVHRELGLNLLYVTLPLYALLCVFLLYHTITRFRKLAVREAAGRRPGRRQGASRVGEPAAP